MTNTIKETNAPRLVLSSIQDLRWGDMDALGHINNTLYFRYMEQARVDWIEKNLRVAVQTPHAHPEQPFLGAHLTEGFVIINASCTFLKPMVYPGQVQVDMYFGSVGRSSVDTTYQIRKVGEATIYAEGASKMVWMNFTSGKSSALPEAVRQLLMT